MRPYLKHTQHKVTQVVRAPVLQELVLEFKPQYHQKKKKEEVLAVMKLNQQ
jgi:hypothetical protein